MTNSYFSTWSVSCIATAAIVLQISNTLNISAMCISPRFAANTANNSEDSAKNTEYTNAIDVFMILYILQG
jgi:hypothetical protein